MRFAVVRQDSLNSTQRQRMLELMQLCYDNVVPDQFIADLAAKQYVILLFARDVLVGFSTIRMAEEELNGRTIELLFSGDTVVHPDHWGQKGLQRAFISFTVRRRLGHPLRPLYWLLLTKGYKTYLLMVRHFPRAFPRYDVQASAPWVRLLTRVASAWWPQAYDRERGVLEFAVRRDHVRASIAPIDGDIADDPHVRYFEARNPGYAKGDELVCLAELRLRDLAWSFVRMAAAQVRLRWRKTWMRGPAKARA